MRPASEASNGEPAMTEAASMLQASGISDTLEAILGSAHQLVDGVEGRIFLAHHDGLALAAEIPAAKGPRSPESEADYRAAAARVVSEGTSFLTENLADATAAKGPSGDTSRQRIAAFPLRIGERISGALILALSRERPLTDRDRYVLTLLADQAGGALENARLYEEGQRHVEELMALHNIDLAITSTLSLDEVLQRVYEQISQLMDVTTFYIGLYEKRRDRLDISLIVDRGERLAPLTLDMQEGGGFAGWVVRNKAPLWIEDWEKEQASLPVQGIARGMPTRSLMVVPLLARDELVGVISTQSYEPYAFDDGHRRLLSSIANQVAVAVDNARLFEEVNRRLKETRLLQRIILAASSALEFEGVVEHVMETLRETLNIERLAFALPDENGDRMIVHSSTRSDAVGSAGPWRLPMDDSIVGRVYQTGQALLFTDISDVTSSLEGEPSTRTELAVPARDGDEVVGVLNAESPLLEEFDHDDLALFSTVAAQLGVVLKNARLFEQTRRRLMETELLQQVMMAGATSLHFDQVLERTVDILHRTLEIEYLSFALPVDARSALRLHPSQIGYDAELPRKKIPLDQSVAGKAFTSGQPQVVDDVRQVPEYYEGAPQVRSEMNVPVKVAERVVAVLNAESARLNAFDERDLRLFEAVAAQLGIVLENARLYESLQEQRDELSQAYEELKEIDRLRTELVQNVSHELRTPFTLVMGYIELLMAGDLGPLSEKQREALYVVRKRVESLQRRTRDLTTLDTLSGREIRGHPTSLLDVVHTAVAEIERQATTVGVQLSQEVPDALSPVLGNKEHLVQAVTHLLDNAVKFSPDGGTVTVRAWEEDGCACIAIDDEGIGIQPQHLEHVFKRFYQVDGSINRRFGGMGVGLAVVWEIIEVYGGTVDVESRPEEGSSFIISLPRANKDDYEKAISLAQAGIEEIGGTPT